jgi:hypothetical protein
MTNNIFVPQTFNGERMVNVNLTNRSKAGNGTSPTPTDNNNSTITRTKIAAVPPSSMDSPANAGKKLNTPVSLVAFENNSSNKKELYIEKYWSEANIAILIQLHRKYFSAIISEGVQQSIDIWNQLAKEFNTITGDERNVDTIIKRWEKVMKKYNAERSCLLLQQRKIAGNQQMPMVSYWNHFQYVDGYLNHLPIPEDSLYLTKIYTRQDEDSDDFDEVIMQGNKSKRHSTSLHDNEEHRKKVYITQPILDDKLQRLEAQRSIMEQTSSRQESQIDMMKRNYEFMNKMNMKFVSICEKITSRSQSNESRYLDLLEKYLDDKISIKNKNTVGNEVIENKNDTIDDDEALEREHNELSPVTAESWFDED